MANHLTILNRSAVPNNIKRNSHTQEVIRRLRNTSRSVEWDIKADIISKFCHSLMTSGYSERYRADIVTAGLKGFEKQCQNADKGIMPLHRPRTYNERERRKKKAIAKSSWYRPNDSVIFIPSTPGSILAKKYRQVLESEFTNHNIRVKVVEQSGISMIKHLVKTDTSGCLIPECPLCKYGVKGASHTRSSAEYQATCLICKKENIMARYKGETGYNAAYRLSQHMTDIKNKTQKWALSKHLVEQHQNNVNDQSSFELKSIKTFQRPLDRQCYEGVMINRSNADIRLNSRAEFHQPSEIRMVTTRQSDETTTTSGRRSQRNNGQS